MERWFLGLVLCVLLVAAAPACGPAEEEDSDQIEPQESAEASADDPAAASDQEEARDLAETQLAESDVSPEPDPPAVAEAPSPSSPTAEATGSGGAVSPPIDKEKSDMKAEGVSPALTEPSKATEQAPEVFKVRFETTEGSFLVEVHREWAPKGADRFYNLIKMGFFEDVAFFRVLDGFVAQFGLSGDPEVSAVWKEAEITDDPVKQSNKRGTLTFATAGPNTRTTQLFINLVDNPRLDGMGFAPFGVVTEGMDVVESFYSGYGEGEPRGRGPNQMLIQTRGNEYLKENYPELDYVKEAVIVDEAKEESGNES